MKPVRQPFLKSGLFYAVMFCGFAWAVLAGAENGQSRPKSPTIKYVSLSAADGYEEKFEIADGYTSYGGKQPISFGPLRIDLWLSNMLPYWDVRADFRQKGIGPHSPQFLKPDYVNYVAIEVFTAGKGALQELKEQTVLPVSVPRNFEIRYRHFYFLGTSADPDGPRPGKQFRRALDGHIQELTSSGHWYVPVDEEKYPAVYLRCTKIRLEPDVRGSCTAFQTLNSRTYYSYRFSPHYLNDWPDLDAKIHAFITALQAP